MNWDKAKNIVILMLLLLNIGLVGLNLKQRDDYKLTPEQEKAIFFVMSKNGVSIYTDLIQTFKPMRQLTVKIPAIETSKLKRVFFGEDEEIRITVDFDKTILKSDTRTLTIENNILYFECPNGVDPLESFTKEEAKEASNRFVRRLGFGASNFELNDMISLQDAYLFEYNDAFEKYKIFSSYNKVTVNENGVVALECAYYEAENFIEDKISICSPDEVLLTLLKELNKEGKKDNLRIDKIEIGYDFQEKSQISEGSALKLIPCYRIVMAGREEPYIINAYTNKIIK